MKALAEQARLAVPLTSHLSNRGAEAGPGRGAHGVPCVLRPDTSGGEDDGRDEEVSEDSPDRAQHCTLDPTRASPTPENNRNIKCFLFIYRRAAPVPRANI